MGMYTQYRGFLCAGSIGSTEDFLRISTQLNKMKEEFKVSNPNLERPWVCDDTTCIPGSNGSIWLFIGSEHKDYDSSMMDWIKFIVNNIPCEGRIEKHYEEKMEGDNIEVIKITPGKIIFSYEPTHCTGYGFRL